MPIPNITREDKAIEHTLFPILLDILLSLMLGVLLLVIAPVAVLATSVAIKTIVSISWVIAAILLSNLSMRS